MITALITLFVDGIPAAFRSMKHYRDRLVYSFTIFTMFVAVFHSSFKTEFFFTDADIAANPTLKGNTYVLYFLLWVYASIVCVTFRKILESIFRNRPWINDVFDTPLFVLIFTLPWACALTFFHSEVLLLGVKLFVAGVFSYHMARLISLTISSHGCMWFYPFSKKYIAFGENVHKKIIWKITPLKLIMIYDLFIWMCLMATIWVKQKIKTLIGVFFLCKED